MSHEVMEAFEHDMETGRAEGGIDVDGADGPSARLDRLERDVQAYRISRDTWTIIVLGVAIVVLFGSIIAVGFALRTTATAVRPPAGGRRSRPTLSEYAIELSSAPIDARTARSPSPTPARWSTTSASRAPIS